jgi:hypothetical protein
MGIVNETLQGSNLKGQCHKLKVPYGRDLVALAALYHVINSKRGIVKENISEVELKGQCHKLKVPDGRGLVALAALHYVLRVKRDSNRKHFRDRIKGPVSQVESS